MYYITGDCHGEFEDVFDFCEKQKTSIEDVLIILGDAGINYYLDWRDEVLKKKLSQLPIIIFCIHGNHEERPQNIMGYHLSEWKGGKVYVEEAYPNLLFAVDGEIYDFDNKKCIVIGGAYSVDKWYRIMNDRPWFCSEQPDERTKKFVESQLERHFWKVDYVFSHTAPLKYEPIEVFLPFIDQRLVDKSTEEWLDDIEQRLDYRCWYLGHYHCEKTVDKICIVHLSIRELGQ